MKCRKIFIACPITKYFDEKSQGMEENFKHFIKKVLEVARRYCDHVFLALEREQFGFARMEGDICTPLDYKEIQNSDLIIAIPEDSMGVAVELGWASSLGKDIIVIVQNKYKYSPLIKSLHTITKVEYIYLNNDIDTVDIFEPILVEALSAFFRSKYSLN